MHRRRESEREGEAAAAAPQPRILLALRTPPPPPPSTSSVSRPSVPSHDLTRCPREIGEARRHPPTGRTRKRRSATGCATFVTQVAQPRSKTRALAPPKRRRHFHPPSPRSPSLPATTPHLLRRLAALSLLPRRRSVESDPRLAAAIVRSSIILPRPQPVTAAVALRFASSKST